MFENVTADEFSRRIASALLDAASSSAFFFLQQAFKDYPGCEFGMGWDEADVLLKKFTTSQPGENTEAPKAGEGRDETIET